MKTYTARPQKERAPATATVRHDAANSIVTASPAAVEVVYNAAGRPVGQLVRAADKRLWLEKRGLDPAVHMLLKPRGWATDTAHLDVLRRRGGAGVRIIDILGRTWTATIESFDRHGILFDRGHGTQVVLPERYWRREAPDALQLALDDLLAPAGAAARAGTGGVG